ncbi:MAG: hypothetical protein Q4D17_06775, partial [Planctomycetia bacterium]|nr:hypothetical protein [Planctomycetia bacterium]
NHISCLIKARYAIWPGLFSVYGPSKTAFQKQKRERFEFEKAPNVPHTRKNTEFPETQVKSGINCFLEIKFWKVVLVFKTAKQRGLT